MAGRGRGKGKGRRDGLTLQLPSHVQNSLNKEERMLHQTLGDIDRETKHRLKCISQDQQVAATKLKILERRLLISQARSKSAVATSHGTCSGGVRSEMRRLMSRMDTCDSSYFKSLMTPAIKDTTQMFEDEQFNTDVGDKRKHSVTAFKRPTKSALKKREGGGERGTVLSGGPDFTRRKSVSFRSS